jgi:hypothetical protein
MEKTNGEKSPIEFFEEKVEYEDKFTLNDEVTLPRKFINHPEYL